MNERNNEFEQVFDLELLRGRMSKNIQEVLDTYTAIRDRLPEEIVASKDKEHFKELVRKIERMEKKEAKKEKRLALQYLAAARYARIREEMFGIFGGDVKEEVAKWRFGASVSSKRKMNRMVKGVKRLQEIMEIFDVPAVFLCAEMGPETLEEVMFIALRGHHWLTRYLICICIDAGEDIQDDAGEVEGKDGGISIDDQS